QSCAGEHPGVIGRAFGISDLLLQLRQLLALRKRRRPAARGLRGHTEGQAKKNENRRKRSESNDRSFCHKIDPFCPPRQHFPDLEHNLSGKGRFLEIEKFYDSYKLCRCRETFVLPFEAGLGRISGWRGMDCGRASGALGRTVQHTGSAEFVTNP